MQPATNLSSGFDQTVTWVIDHPIISGITIFLVALLESLVIIGVLVPGALFMVLLGVLISKGAISLSAAIAWAASGAIVGDAISFWIGRHYKDRLRKIWPFSRSQTLLAKGEAFFNRHGGKSIFFGRFVGPIRAIIPTIAGILGMSAKKFAVVNILSALAWAPTYILPGLIVGATSGISFRLVIILLIIISLLLFTHWLVRNLFSFF